MHFENPHIIDNVGVYKIAKKWVNDRHFSITRCRTSQCDGLPFELMDQEWVYKIVSPTHSGTSTSFVGDIDHHFMINLVQSAMLWGAEFDMSRPAYIDSPRFPFFIEEAYSEPSEDDPDGHLCYFPHWEMLEDRLREECQFDEDLDDYYINLMDAYLTLEHQNWMNSRDVVQPMEIF